MIKKQFSFLVLCYVFAPFIHASGPSCDDPRAAPIGTPDVEMDGFFIGLNSCAYDPSLVTSDQVPAVGNQYEDGGEPLFAVNGANATVVQNEIRLSALSSAKRRPVIGIYNAVTNIAGELNKFVDIDNAAANTVRREGFSRVVEGRKFAVIGVSQSGFMIGRGLTLLKKDLIDSFPFRYFYRQKLLNLIDVETLGTFGLFFPDGPNYVHYVNNRDILPHLAGIASHAAHPGRGAVLATYYYYNEDCQFGMSLLEEYPGDNADLSRDKPPEFSGAVHSICSYAASGLDFESLRQHAPLLGTVEVEIELTPQ